MNRPRPGSPALGGAAVAAVLGLGHAAVSAYWAAGGRVLLDTVGGQLEQLGNAGGGLITAGLWLVVLIKVGAVLILVGNLRPPFWPRVFRLLGWLEAVVLLAYGGVLTAAGLLVQAGAIATGPESNQRALAWHAYFWDPWFLLWGVAGLLVMLWTRTARVRQPVRAAHWRHGADES